MMLFRITGYNPSQFFPKKKKLYFSCAERFIGHFSRDKFYIRRSRCCMSRRCSCPSWKCCPSLRLHRRTFAFPDQNRGCCVPSRPIYDMRLTIYEPISRTKPHVNHISKIANQNDFVAGQNGRHPHSIHVVERPQPGAPAFFTVEGIGEKPVIGKKDVNVAAVRRWRRR